MVDGGSRSGSEELGKRDGVGERKDEIGNTHILFTYLNYAFGTTRILFIYLLDLAFSLFISRSTRNGKQSVLRNESHIIVPKRPSIE